MKRKVLKGSNGKRRKSSKMKGTLAKHLQVQLGEVSVLPFQFQQSSSSTTAVSNSSSLLQNLLDSEASDPQLHYLKENPSIGNIDIDEKDFILSQDLFCTPDYITPVDQILLNSFDCNKENVLCPESPEKLNTIKTKKLRQDVISVNTLTPALSENIENLEIARDAFCSDELKIEKTTVPGTQKNYVSQSAVALRCRVMPLPCIKNPFLMHASDVDIDPFGNKRSKCAGFFSAIVRGGGLSRYHSDFHEMQQIDSGSFSCAFKVLKRIDGCMYAVKHSTRQLHQDSERRKALMEVQALAALGHHENIVEYYSSWFENEQIYIQMELCDCSLSIHKSSKSFTEDEVLEVLHQIAKALQFIHEKGIAHLDVKPDNIYVKNGVYKLGDFGCATLLNQSLPIEEGDARYMPQGILNVNYNHLDKVDIFSLGAAIYELIRGSPLRQSGSQFLNLREGKLPLLPGHSLQFQNLLKVMLDPDPVQRPSAKEIIENPIFDKLPRNLRI
ncbi:wee1-like protein kinase isoform X1 [Manihot esculenta]|uniref:Wee1-like protein kinase n=1 Tax=Manihot esculenta TaxID=3983 RepID=A0A2C9WQA5_MANES|nr:wee1-like protein kinase isoform X1 [Manihot esculenta]OAY61784.1 hypothetical protein MANES_01G215900v8 [Manihot esculenta]